jgi:hypothetical protein
MSIFENPKKVLKKGVFFGLCDENAHKNKKMLKTIVMLIFMLFLKNRLAFLIVS